MGMVSTSKAKDVKAAVQHDCPFCSNLRALRDSRWLRVLHNLVAFAEAVQIVMDGAQNPDLLLKTLRR
jgi:hypothetical protein